MTVKTFKIEEKVWNEDYGIGVVCSIGENVKVLFNGGVIREFLNGVGVIAEATYKQIKDVEMMKRYNKRGGKR